MVVRGNGNQTLDRACLCKTVAQASRKCEPPAEETGVNTPQKGLSKALCLQLTIGLRPPPFAETARQGGGASGGFRGTTNIPANSSGAVGKSLYLGRKPYRA